MDTEKKTRRSFLLAATGVVTAGGVTGCSGSPDRKRPSIIHPGGSVAMALDRLEAAEKVESGGWKLKVDPSDVVGIEVPKGFEQVEISLTDEQMAKARSMAGSADSKTVVFVEHSGAWTDKMKERLLGGFSIEFTRSVCDYNQPWS